MHRAPLMLLCVLVASLVAAVPASAATITVSILTDDWGNEPGCSLREAVYAANHDERFSGCPAGSTGVDTIVLGAGTYELDEVGADDSGIDGDLDINSDLRIRGAGSLKTAIDGNDIARVFDIGPVGAADVTISRLTIRGGKASTGGGLRNATNLRLDRVSLTGNEAATAGGAIENTGVLTGSRLRIEANRSSGEGGGIESAGTTRITTSTIRANVADGEGGAIDLAGGSLTLRRSLVEANRSGAGGGGGIDHGGTALRVEDSTLTGNRTSGGGGGILTQPGSPATVTRSTIVNNVAAAASGGGIDATGAVEVSRSILSSNPPQNCFGGVTSAGSNIDSGSSCPFAGPGDLQNTNPQLRPLADHGGPTRTHALRGTSPAIDSAGACSGLDQRGVPRPFGGDCDRGASERALCAGVVVNRVGTDGADLLTGTERDDGILGLGGRDRLRGLGGQDGLCGGNGGDRLAGGSGDDRLRGGAGLDLCIGGPGDDRAASCEERRSI